MARGRRSRPAEKQRLKSPASSGTKGAAPDSLSETCNETVRVMNLSPIMVRYIVNDVDATIDFYTRHFGFNTAAQSGPHFAILEKENLQLVLSPPQGPGGGSQPMPDGRKPEPGGWNRIIVRSNSLDKDVSELRKAGVKFRNEIVSGPGGRQILVVDPSDNLVEIFEPAAESKQERKDD